MPTKTTICTNKPITGMSSKSGYKLADNLCENYDTVIQSLAPHADLSTY